MNVNLSQFEKGRQRIAARVRKIDADSDRAMTPISKAMAEAVKEEIIKRLEAPKSGTVWSEGAPWSGGWWSNYYNKPSSAPGEAPADQSGGLKGAITVNESSKGRANLDVGDPDGRPGVARLLEFGGWTSAFGNRVAPRPFIMPSLAAKKKDLRQIAIDEYKKFVNLGRA